MGRNAKISENPIKLMKTVADEVTRETASKAVPAPETAASAVVPIS